MPLPDLVRALESGELSPTEHVEDVLARLDADTTNCVITLDAERARAAELTASSARGERAGPLHGCLLYTSPSPRDRQKSRMPSSA